MWLACRAAYRGNTSGSTTSRSAHWRYALCWMRSPRRKSAARPARSRRRRSIWPRKQRHCTMSQPPDARSGRAGCASQWLSGPPGAYDDSGQGDALRRVRRDHRARPAERAGGCGSQVNLATEQATVAYVPTSVETSTLRQAITRAGYEPLALPADAALPPSKVLKSMKCGRCSAVFW